MGKTGMWGHLILILIMNSTGYSSKLSLVLKCVIPYAYKPVSISSVTMKNFGYYMAMVVVQFAYGGSNILIKIALERGLNQFVFLVYRHNFPCFFNPPPKISAEPVLYFASRKERPSLSLPMFGQIFLFSSLGTTIHLNLYFAALAYTSPTVATAWSIVIPSLTFLMAVFLRMENVKIRSGSGGAKSEYSRHGNESWIKGSALDLVSYIAWSGWLILQAEVYPPQLSLNALICFIASFQSSVLALFFARNPLLWRLERNVQLLTITTSLLQFSAMFIPLLVIVAIFSAIVFAERLHLGSMVGTFLILYFGAKGGTVLSQEIQRMEMIKD
ncbi:hypothetical protein GOBAR_DD11535 [Gossypium barbadense]|nr:hypothetical protein GOBAR_DD11535 [Gossypium barbadense]